MHGQIIRARISPDLIDRDMSVGELIFCKPGKGRDFKNISAAKISARHKERAGIGTAVIAIAIRLGFTKSPVQSVIIHRAGIDFCTGPVGVESAARKFQAG